MLEGYKEWNDEYKVSTFAQAFMICFSLVNFNGSTWPLRTTDSSPVPSPLPPKYLPPKYRTMPSRLFKCIPFLHPKPHPFPLSHLTTMSTKTKTRLRGVVFDMDGTLTVPVIDFSSMYKAVLGETEYRRIRQENPSGIDILHLIESWSPDQQRKANEIILDFERLGRERLQIMPGESLDCSDAASYIRFLLEFTCWFFFVEITELQVRLSFVAFLIPRKLGTKSFNIQLLVFHLRWGI